MDFNATMLMDTLYLKIDKYVQISQNAGQPVTQAQVIALAMIILKKTGVFTTYIAQWHRRPPPKQTWIFFKDFFCNAQNELHNSNSLTSQEALAQLSANMVAQQVTDQIFQHPVFHMEEVQVQPPSAPAPAPPAPAPNPPADVNNINNASSMEQMMQQMIQLMMQQQQPPPYQQQYFPRGGGRGYHGGRGGGRGNYGGRGRGGRGPIIFNKYCWTHGLCTHTSQECRNRAEGHKENAMLTNRMGGSNRNL